MKIKFFENSHVADGTILDGTCEGETKFPGLGKIMCDSGFPFPQIIILAIRGIPKPPPALLSDFSFVFFFPLPEAISF